ncbi:hypothetical protein GQ600_16910 [Phytophthora cactorum]|nr:hypothetical protein GQ600_16910 [Phytophthora cactorum]
MASFVASLSQVGAHGYMYIRWPSSRTRSRRPGSCRSSRSGRVTGTVQQQRRRLIDDALRFAEEIERLHDTDLYGANCGFTDPDAAAKDPPTRAMPPSLSGGRYDVLSNDDCQTAYGDGTQEKASVFTPVDHSSCSTSGCMLRFYWLAFQGVDSKTVWQVYKDCVPLTGPAEIDQTSTPRHRSERHFGHFIDGGVPTDHYGDPDFERSLNGDDDGRAGFDSFPSEKCTARKRQ